VRRADASGTDDDLRSRSASPAWTVGAVLTHLVWSWGHFCSEGFRDIAGPYAGQVDHLAEHANEVRRAVPHFTEIARTTH
jgi:hypothetical protein